MKGVCGCVWMDDGGEELWRPCRGSRNRGAKPFQTCDLQNVRLIISHSLPGLTHKPHTWMIQKTHSIGGGASACPIDTEITTCGVRVFLSQVNILFFSMQSWNSKMYNRRYVTKTQFSPSDGAIVNNGKCDSESNWDEELTTGHLTIDLK